MISYKEETFFENVNKAVKTVLLVLLTLVISFTLLTLGNVMKLTVMVSTRKAMK